jgi:hypothetical protein
MVHTLTYTEITCRGQHRKYGQTDRQTGVEVTDEFPRTHFRDESSGSIHHIIIIIDKCYNCLRCCKVIGGNCYDGECTMYVHYEGWFKKLKVNRDFCPQVITLPLIR